MNTKKMMIKGIEVKPCPFDGSIPELSREVRIERESRHDFVVRYKLFCPLCGCSRGGDFKNKYKVDEHGEIVLNNINNSEDTEIVLDSLTVLVNTWNERCCECVKEEVGGENDGC